MSVGLTPLSSLSDQQVRAAFTRVMPLSCFEQQRRQRKGLPMARHQPKHAAKAFNRFQVQRGLLLPFPAVFISTLPSSAGGSELALISSLQSASHQHEPRGEGESIPAGMDSAPGWETRNCSALRSSAAPQRLLPLSCSRDLVLGARAVLSTSCWAPSRAGSALQCRF